MKYSVLFNGQCRSFTLFLSLMDVSCYIMELLMFHFLTICYLYYCFPHNFMHLINVIVSHIYNDTCLENLFSKQKYYVNWMKKLKINIINITPLVSLRNSRFLYNFHLKWNVQTGQNSLKREVAPVFYNRKLYFIQIRIYL